ncbi:MAG: hypothetical protein GEV09_22565 [Pseudonocardiaceae bacterium]|nr:hypothetical protein [Pseudonocardiaceae bacterium]
MTGRRRRRSGGAGEEARRKHAWLELLQTSGPFLTLPVVHRLFPDGLPPVPKQARAGVRAAVTDMLDGNGASRHALVDFVLRDLLGWGEHYTAYLPDAAAAIVVEHGTSVRPDFAFVVGEADVDDGHDELDDDDPDDREPDERDPEEDPEPEDAEAPSGPYRMLGMVAPWGTHPLMRTTERGWTASAAERLAVLLRARGVPIGLVTDGRWWAVVWAPPGGATGVAVWDASLFSEEPDSLRAFVAFLGRARFLGDVRENTLPALLNESAERQEELTEQLGEQVRDAVELLLDTLDRLDAESDGGLLLGVDDDELYAGVVTVMMRVVFALFAEERRLLPSDDECYAASYSVGGLVKDLRDRAQLAGRRSLEHRTSAWHRLLAVARAIHRGVAHEDLRLPAYGGGLFDPDRHPWLEGRGPDGTGRPPPVDDRTVLRMLEAVQYVVLDGEERRLSFRALGVEQIGYVYEGLLELEVRTATEVTLGLARHSKWPRSKKGPSEVGITEARDWVDAVPPTVAEQVKARTGWTESKVEQALRDAVDEHLLTAALGGDRELLEVTRAIAPALRRDDRLRPVITLPGRRYIAPSRRRATTGTHYTPPQLAAEVAIGALEPLVYRPGPLETADRSLWRLRPSDELLGLRIADIAMGSGAFLVAACRWLADRLLEAWTAEGDVEALREAQAGPRATADAEASPVVLRARRRVAEKCLYGVDINPLAVEMGKLSLWLVTMDRERPFGFLDDRFVAGDSLLGLVTVEQLENAHIDPAAARRSSDQFAFEYTAGWRPLLSEAADARRRITARPVQELRDVEHKQHLLAEATVLTGTLTSVADAITGVGLAYAASAVRKTETAFVQLGVDIGNRLGDDEERLRLDADANLQAGRPHGLAARTPLHWPLAFPEVLVDRPDPGFDAIIGNPPFSGGQMISGGSGTDYQKWLQRWDGGGTKGSTDLAARFVLRAQRLLNSRGQLGYVATNTLTQGKTLVVGMMQAVDRGSTIRRGRSSHQWPGRANLEIVEVWASCAPVAAAGEIVLDGEPVPEIGPDLEPVGRIKGQCHVA